MSALLEKYEIRVYNKAGTQTAYVSSTAGQPAVVVCRFTLARIGGCTTLELSSPAPGLPGTVVCGYLIEFWAKPVGGSLARYWRGEVIECPNTGNTADVLEYRAVGLMSQLKHKLIERYYDSAGVTVEAMVQSLIGLEFSVDTDIETDVTEVSITGDHTMIGDMEFEFSTCAEALKLFAQVQKSVDYGVDQDGWIYFKNRDTTTVQERYWVGKHLASYETTENMDSVMNSVLVQSKDIVGGGLLTLHAEDATSIAAYGRRQRVEQVAHLKHGDDVYRIAEGLIADEKDPRTQVEADVLLSFSDFYFPTGAVVVTDIDGNAVTLPIQKTIYTLDSSGFRGRFELGDEPVVAVDLELQRLWATIALREVSQISFGRISHTRGQEFLIAANYDAGEQPNQNRYMADFSRIGMLDEANCEHMAYDQKRKFLGCDIDRDGALYTLNTFPSGQEADTIRLHWDVSLGGRINFSHDSDLGDFWASNSDWRVKEGTNKLEHFQSGAALDYLWGTSMTMPTDGFIVKFGVVDALQPSATSTVYPYWQDANNHIYVTVQNTAANFIVILGEVVAATPAALLTYNTGTKDNDHEIEVNVESGAGNSYLKVYRAGVEVYSATTTASVGSITATDIKLDNDWYNSGSAAPNMYLDYFDVFGVGGVQFSVSRLGDPTDVDTWNPTLAQDGIFHYDIDVSGQGAGSEILLTASVAAPARVYGLGASWNHA